MMKMFIVAASAAALTFSMPAVAENPGKGSAPKAQQSQNANSQSKSNRDTRSTARARTDVRTDRRDGVRDGVRDDRRFDRDRISDRMQNRHSVRDCPPGLAKKTPACIPPGQAKRMFNEGQRLPTGFDAYNRYDEIPERFRSRVPFSQDARYIYRDDRVYMVDPATRLVTRIIDLFR